MFFIGGMNNSKVMDFDMCYLICDMFVIEWGYLPSPKKKQNVHICCTFIVIKSIISKTLLLCNKPHLPSNMK